MDMVTMEIWHSKNDQAIGGIPLYKSFLHPVVLVSHFKLSSIDVRPCSTVFMLVVRGYNQLECIASREDRQISVILRSSAKTKKCTCKPKLKNSTSFLAEFLLLVTAVWVPLTHTAGSVIMTADMTCLSVTSNRDFTREFVTENHDPN